MTTDLDLAPRLRMAVMRLARRLRQENPQDLTQSQQSVLAVLHRDGPMRLSSLAAAEGVKLPSVMRVVHALELAGLASRRPDPTDRRSVIIELTDQGAKLVKATRQRRDAFLTERLAALTPKQRRTLAEAVALLESLHEDRP